MKQTKQKDNCNMTYVYSKIFHIFFIFTYYLIRYQTQANIASFGDIITNRFIISTFHSVKWFPPALTTFLDLNVPVAFGYGSNDDITPSHQGTLLSALSGVDVPVYEIKEAWHCPFHIRNGIDFIHIIKLAEYTAVRPSQVAKTLAIVLKDFPWDNYSSTFSRTQTAYTIRRLYKDLLQIKYQISNINYRIL
jgi:hypothetical protein